MASVDGQWVDICKLTERDGPFSHKDFEPSEFCVKWLREECRVLCIGAGGLGCELLKDLALVGFRNIEVIDMDIIDYSNLNRQFLFRVSDVGRSKALAAANFINNRVAGTKVVPHHARIEDFDDTFYRGFHLVVSGLDSVNARRWLNNELVSLAALGPDETWDPVTCIPCINGGTEGWKGETRVIQPYFTPCFECLVELFPKEPFNFPMCTYAHTPRQPEHCIVYAMERAWPEEFGEDKKWDGDNEDDITWLMNAAQVHADKHGITGITYKLTQGVVKRIIPALASTNACISAACANEAFKIVTFCHDRLDNFMQFSGNEGCYTNSLKNEINDQCLTCGREALEVSFDRNATLQEFLDWIVADEDAFKFFARPVLRWAENSDDHDCPFIHAYGVFANHTKPNLTKTLIELLEHDGTVIHLQEAKHHKVNELKIKWKPEQEDRKSVV